MLEYFSLTGIVKVSFIYQINYCNSSHNTTPCIMCLQAAAVCSHILDNYFYPDAPKKKVLIFAHHQIVLDTVQVEVDVAVFLLM